MNKEKDQTNKMEPQKENTEQDRIEQSRTKE